MSFTVVGFLRRSWMTFLLVWAGLALVSVSWALATPLGASPDEPAHIIKAAAVVRGELLGDLTDTPGVTTVQVPPGIASAKSWTCYAFQAMVEANCILPIIDAPGLAAATTSAGLYNPVYYTVVGWPSLLTQDTGHAVFAMRAMSALLSSFFLAVAFCALLQFRKPIITGLAFLAAATPMVFFLAGAVNPNALEISSGAALLCLLLALVRAPHVEHERVQLALVVASGFFLANSRGLSPLWMACIAAAVLVCAPPVRLAELLRRPQIWAVVVLLGLSVLAAGLWILNTGTLDSMGVYPGAGITTPANAFVTMLVDRSFDIGTIAVFGWLDTFVPNFVPYFWSFLFFLTVLAGVAVARGRVLMALMILIAALFLVPPIAQAMSVETSGYIWQGRYTLVAYVCTILMAGVAAALAFPRLPTFVSRTSSLRAVVIVSALVIVGQVFSILVAVKRYAVGSDGAWTSLFRNAVWAPPGGLLLWPAVLCVGMALLMAVWFIWVYPTLPRIAAGMSSRAFESTAVAAVKNG